MGIGLSKLIIPDSMKKLFSFFALAVVFLLLTGCPYGYKYDQGRFPADPVNFAAANSAYDDYNSTSPVIEDQRYLYFSSNRSSGGGQFDLVGENLRVMWDKETGRLVVDDKPHDWKDYGYTDSLFKKVNSSFDEFGPYSLPFLGYAGNAYRFTDLLVYANNAAGNLDLKFAWFEGQGENPKPSEGTYHGPLEIAFLNSPDDDAYLTFYGPGFVHYDYYAVDPSSIREIIFSSNRNGDHDLYMVNVPAETDIIAFLGQPSGPSPLPVSVLNSGHNDKCPYADGDLLVFASDRPGGFGGYDLYYAIRYGNNWSEPVNFGSRINTEYDEFRPIVAYNYEFVNDLMIFSSNRPGGKGGFDLYYAGIPRMHPSIE